MWTVWGKPFSIPARLCPDSQSKVCKDMVGWVWCGRIWLAHTEPWPQPHQYLWEELEWRLWARPFHPKLVPDLIKKNIYIQKKLQNPTETLQNLGVMVRCSKTFFLVVYTDRHLYKSFLTNLICQVNSNQSVETSQRWYREMRLLLSFMTNLFFKYHSIFYIIYYAVLLVLFISMSRKHLRGLGI